MRPQAAIIAHILLVMHRVDHGPRAEKQQCLEEGMGEQMEHRAADCGEQVRGKVVAAAVALAGLTERVASASNIEAYARLVKEKAKLRRLMENPKTPPERLGLFAFLLSAAGDGKDSGVERQS